MRVQPLSKDPRRAEILQTYASWLRDKGLKPGDHFSNALLHQAIWTGWSVRAWIGIHRDELAEIADFMEDAGLIRPSFGPRGGEGWTLV